MTGHEIFRNYDINKKFICESLGINEHDKQCVINFIGDILPDNEKDCSFPRAIIQILNRFQNEPDLQCYGMFVLGGFYHYIRTSKAKAERVMYCGIITI